MRASATPRSAPPSGSSRAAATHRLQDMKLATYLPPGGGDVIHGEVRDGVAVAFDDGSTVLGRLASGDRTSAAGEAFPVGDVTLLAPHTPRAIFGIGLNYLAHAREQGQEPPERPIVFMKLPASATGPHGPIRCPEVVRRLDYEGELAVVMGAGGAIAGFAVADDVSARDLQGREPQWVRAKGADTFCPYGPWVTTADAVPDPKNLRLRTWVNEEERQNSSTSDLIFGPQACADYIAQTCSLHPGDLILTGTPSGVGMATGRFLQEGDVVRIEIESLGVIEHRVIRR